jgi:hypothetical protein
MVTDLIPFDLEAFSLINVQSAVCCAGHHIRPCKQLRIIGLDRLHAAEDSIHEYTINADTVEHGHYIAAI